jgi:hypothetical protein
MSRTLNESLSIEGQLMMKEIKEIEGTREVCSPQRMDHLAKAHRK